jgi:hypothetical protein
MVMLIGLHFRPSSPPPPYVAPGRLLFGASCKLHRFSACGIVGVVQCLLKPSTGNMKVVSNAFTNDAI